MRSKHLGLFSVVLLVVGCGAKIPTHEHPETLSVNEHEQHAQEHEVEAVAMDSQGEPNSVSDEPVTCIDEGIPLSSGGEPIVVMKPCWTERERSAAYHRDAEAHRRAAADHRRWAKLLVDVEKESCQTLGVEERRISPLERTPDILAVEEYRESGELMGAKITLRRVPGLSAAWMGAAILCHQARAATLGFDQTFMERSPLTAGKLAASVSESAKEVVVILRTSDGAIAAAVYGRAALRLEKAGQ